VISVGAQTILKLMVKAEAAEAFEDAELVCERTLCFVGCRNTSRAIVNELLRHALLRDMSEAGAGIERYTLNSDGRLAALDRSHVNEAFASALAERL
jgi:hypothetical protein